jgi:hypothetical protein
MGKTLEFIRRCNVDTIGISNWVGSASRRSWALEVMWARGMSRLSYVSKRRYYSSMVMQEIIPLDRTVKLLPVHPAFSAAGYSTGINRLPDLIGWFHRTAVGHQVFATAPVAVIVLSAGTLSGSGHWVGPVLVLINNMEESCQVVSAWLPGLGFCICATARQNEECAKSKLGFGNRPAICWRSGTSPWFCSPLRTGVINSSCKL